MMTVELPSILVIDDQETILENFARLLEPAQDRSDAAVGDTFDELELALGGGSSSKPMPVIATPRYQVRYARQGAEGVRACAAAVEGGAPFAVAFVDIHMPPGIDGIETVSQLWRAQPDLEVVLCTAYSDYSWHAILRRLVQRDQLLILRKPFDPIEVRQLAACLSEKWRRGRALALRMEQLEAQVQTEVARRLHVELQRSQKFEALGRLAAGIAHEINTPAQYIQSNLEFFAESFSQVATGYRHLREGAIELDLEIRQELDEIDELIPEVPEALTNARRGVARVTAIVNSVREYAHTSQQAAEPVDINRQIRMAAELARNQYKHDAELTLELGELPILPGNADELGRAILNLLINAAQAVHAARGDGPRGRIGIVSRATPQAIHVEISDTGLGIAPEHRDRVFEPFFTTKPLGQGTGQGLTMARAVIVERHHGTLSFETEPGLGTTFHITLPVPAGAAAMAAPAEPAPLM
jgi:two-component system NtrC family sensor kinase